MAEHGLITGTVFAHRAVDDLTPEGKADLLESARRDGWEFVTRSITGFPVTDSKGETTGEELVEWWYFRRMRL